MIDRNIKVGDIVRLEYYSSDNIYYIEITDMDKISLKNIKIWGLVLLANNNKRIINTVCGWFFQYDCCRLSSRDEAVVEAL